MKDGDSAAPVEGTADESSQTPEVRVTVIETATGKTLSGEEAPLASQVQAWLEMHPGWEVVPREDDDDDEEGSDEDGSEEEEEGKNPRPIAFVKIYIKLLKSLETYFDLAPKPPPPPPVAPVVEVIAKDPEAVPEEVVKEVIQKAKVEDDEYKNQSERSYYGIAHTIREEVTEQASIMVNGKLKEYQIKVSSL